MEPSALSLYHRVDIVTWYVVREILQRLIREALQDEKCNAASPVSLDDADTLLLFLNEMEVGYLHPRRTSPSFILSSRRRPAASNRSAYPQKNKNLSTNEKNYG